jgi:hypothetical protein
MYVQGLGRSHICVSAYTHDPGFVLVRMPSLDCVGAHAFLILSRFIDLEIGGGQSS